MINATKQQYDALIIAAREKLRYEAAMEEYRHLPAFRRFFTRQPKDITPGYSFHQLNSILSDTFRRAHPELNRYVPGECGPHSYRMSFDIELDKEGQLRGRIRTESFTGGRYRGGLFHDEFKEYRVGYGLVDEFIHDSDPIREIHNRNVAAERAAVGRDTADLFVDFHKRVDDICFNEFREYPRLDRDTMTPKNVVKLVNVATDDSKMEQLRAEDLKVYKKGIPELESLGDYVAGEHFIEEVTTAALKRKLSSIPGVPYYKSFREQLEVADHFYCDAVYKTEEFFDYKLWDKLQEARPSDIEKPALGIIIDYAKRYPQEKDPVYRAAKAATLLGYSKDDIRMAFALNHMDGVESDRALSLAVEEVSRQVRKDFMTLTIVNTNSKEPAASLARSASDKVWRHICEPLVKEVEVYSKLKLGNDESRNKTVSESVSLEDTHLKMIDRYLDRTVAAAKCRVAECSDTLVAEFCGYFCGLRGIPDGTMDKALSRRGVEGSVASSVARQAYSDGVRDSRELDKEEGKDVSRSRGVRI